MNKNKSKNEISVSGASGNIAVLNHGDSAGEPILAVHGWLDNAASFTPLAQLLPQYNWFSMDLPGHGHSQHRPPGCVYHYTDYIADVFKTLQGLGAATDGRISDQPINLVGHSLGAGIVAAFAAIFPERVKNLVLIDGIGPISADDEDTLEQLRKSMDYLTRPPSTPRAYPSWEYLVQRRMSGGEIQQHSVQTLLQRGASDGQGDQGEITVLSDRRLKYPSAVYMNEHKVRSILSGIQCPALLVIADNGVIGKRDFTAGRIQAIKNLKTVTVCGAHHVHLDEPGAVSTAIDDFLRG